MTLHLAHSEPERASLPTRAKDPGEYPDLESQMGPEDHHDLRLWLRMLSCCNLIENEIRSRLRTEYDTTLPRFELMAQLQRAPGGLKMTELSRYMMVTNGNITGITDQLEKEGMVERVRNRADRRSSLVRLTAKGRRAFQAMARSHEQWLTSMFDGLSDNNRERLFEALGQLKSLVRLQPHAVSAGN